MKPSAAAAAALCALALAGAVASAEPETPTYLVVSANTSVPAHAIRDRIMQPDRSVLISTHSRRWYRVVLHGGCTRAGWPGAQVGFVTLSGGVIDRSSTAVIDGESCAVRSIDEIEAPTRAEPESSQQGNTP